MGSCVLERLYDEVIKAGFRLEYIEFPYPNDDAGLYELSFSYSKLTSYKNHITLNIKLYSADSKEDTVSFYTEDHEEEADVEITVDDLYAIYTFFNHICCLKRDGYADVVKGYFDTINLARLNQKKDHPTIFWNEIENGVMAW